ncbi:MAG: ChbG/HpnK family deacetylase [Bradyrhizobiaceae bacterium]|nr:MAG: ChbG/HpnK family deacetylase [Bradyrhizobiaceae bacterium]
MSGEMRRVTLCADDYGISPGVNRAIVELIGNRRLNATSVMMVGPAIGRDDVAALKETAAAANCAIGLHVTLTAPFAPLSLHFKPLVGGNFPQLGDMLQASILRRLDSEIVHSEIAAQIAFFIERFGRAPDYLDGHQHVHIFPQIRDAFLTAVKEAAPGAWVRQCGRSQTRAVLKNPKGHTNPKALLLDVLSAKFRRLCARKGIAFNPAFAGAYDFAKASDFAALMDGFLKSVPEGGLVMCHPGFVDEVLLSLDPLTDQREREYAFLAGDDFPKMLAANDVRLS